MTLEQWYDLTPREFQNFILGHQEKDEREFRLKWEITRWITAQLATRLSWGKTNIRKPQDLIVFPWEKTVKRTKAQITRLLRLMDDGNR